MSYSITDKCGDNPHPTLKEFCKELQKNKIKISLFGAGKNGEFISHYINFSGFVAELFFDNSPQRVGKKVNKIPIKSPKNIQDFGVIITSEANADAIMGQLLDKGLDRKNIYVLRQRELQIIFDTEPEWPAYITKNYFLPLYLERFNAEGINCTGTFIEANGCIIPNPFVLSTDYQIAFFCEIVDYILPGMLNDYSMIVEGPGEHGEVKINKGDVVFDLGANIGLFSLLAASKGAKVYAFEPIPDVLKHLALTQQIYPIIEIIDKAASNTTGKTPIKISSSTNTASSFILPIEGKSIEIECISIDEFVEKNKINTVDFIKADIEGAERLMLMGAEKTLKQFGPKLSICTYHLPDDKEILEQIILKSNPNYVIEHKWQKLYAHIPKII